MSISYNSYLVILSILVAMQAGYVGLNLAKRIPGSFALHRRALIAGSAITLAVGIWSMHFIGMLAMHTIATISYLAFPTLASFLICVLVTGIAVYLASLRSSNRIVFAAVFMGFGIASMHYVGMTAIGGEFKMQHNHGLVFASVVIAISASGLALWLAFLADDRFQPFIGAIVFGLAVSGMHYTAMAGTFLEPLGSPTEAGSTISGDNLAMIVSVVSFSISGLFMLMLVPKQNLVEADDNEENGWQGPAEVSDAKPLAGSDDAAVDQKEQTAKPKEPVAASLFPIEKNGQRFHIAASEILSVHANAHYTYLFNGTDDLFCHFSISEMSDRLSGPDFFQTHRSYIVNLNNVVRIRKSGDAAIAELDCSIRRTVPVSRARVPLLRKEWENFRLRKTGAIG